MVLFILTCFVGFTSFFDSRISTITSSDIAEQIIDTTRTYTVNRILIIGNKKTHTSIILRELNVQPGDTIRGHILNQVILWNKRRVYNLRLFNVVSIQPLKLPADQIDLLIEVQERWYTWPIPIFDLSDRNFNEWWQTYNHDINRINYGLTLEQHNVRGRNETLKLTGQFGFTQRYKISYSIPYIDEKQKQGLYFYWEYTVPKNLASSTKNHKLIFTRNDQPLLISSTAQIGYSYRKFFFETHAFSLGYKYSAIANKVLLENPNYFLNNQLQQQYLSISYSFLSERRDVVLYPLKGYQLSGYIQRNGLGIEGPINQWIFNITYAHHVDLKKQFYASNFSAIYASSTTNQPYSMYGALGYLRQMIRGYDLYVIEGPVYIINKTTFKKRIFSRTWKWNQFPLPQFRHLPFSVYLKTFLDFGYVENYPYYNEHHLNTQLTNTLLAGYGYGLDFILPYDLVIRIEYALTKENTQGLFINFRKEF